jgi:hypothetical protein
MNTVRAAQRTNENTVRGKPRRHRDTEIPLILFFLRVSVSLWLNTGCELEALCLTP